MPSTSHLSSTQTNLAQLNLRYANFDNAEYSQDNDNYDCFPVHGVDNIIIKKCSFLRNSSRLPPDVCSLFGHDFTAQRKQSQHVQSSNAMRLSSEA